MYASSNGKDIALDDYLKKIISYSSSEASTKDLDSRNFNCEVDNLEVSKSVPLGIILNELLSDSKRRYLDLRKRWDFQVDLMKKGDQLCFRFTDDLVKELKSSSTSSFIIQCMVKQIRGSVELTGSKNEVVQITFNS